MDQFQVICPACGNPFSLIDPAVKLSPSWELSSADCPRPRCGGVVTVPSELVDEAEDEQGESGDDDNETFE